MLNILERARSNAEGYFAVFSKRRRLDVFSFTSTVANPPTQDPVTITCLPKELLIEIFKLLLEDHLAQPDVLFKCHAPQVVLALVCREWKAVVRSLPQLWSYIPAGASASYASACLDRSTGLPLRLGLKFGLNSGCKSLPDFRKQARCALGPFTVSKSGVTRLPLNERRVRELAISVSPYFVRHFHVDDVWHQYTFRGVHTLHVSFKKTQFDADAEAALQRFA
ncbi:hypothetical protein PENSPDRAFT_693767 [Peniophora sp. CONT]|nr:hypothetical protein PENSPDRAFT_693767 [Peniophora sp. CONT]